MSVRRELYDLLLQMPDGNAPARITHLAAFLDSLPPEELPAVERRMLAFTQAYKAMVEGGMKGRLDDFIAAVDEAERRLTN
ncbi:MAG: hypothetical protein JHD15_15870 [Phenylobacterium sp.]|uniref:hypothetical protein n=1 Tax=Phenylobacterium sp. TaxID=1871053 RepID=UPI001A26BF88|nr:hypothetical protein [Phenylobacterium sp.]MBJ7411824.1 hypothetical protein [Phenylobacterium sp.]